MPIHFIFDIVENIYDNTEHIHDNVEHIHDIIENKLDWQKKQKRTCSNHFDVVIHFQLSIKRITFVPLQSAGLSLVLRDGRNVRATESTILLNGKLSARAE